MIIRETMKVRTVMAAGARGDSFTAPMRLLVTTLIFWGALVQSGFSQSIPDNASPRQFGGGWSCNRGYAQSGNSCVKVIPPENASLNYLGNGWECNRGYYQSGESCAAVVIPEHAALDYLGHKWECNRGYYQTDKSCSAVTIPKNAALDYLGHAWQCDRGYVQSGDSCLKLDLPAHASLDYLGHNWTCDRGFKRDGSDCVPMTAQEVQRQTEQAAAIAREIQRRRSAVASGDNCETEDKTGANVCVTVTDATLDCHKAFDESRYTDCDADVSYSLKTDYRGNSSLDTDVDCSVEISYSGRNTVITKTDSDSDTNSHTLEAHDETSESANMNFSFSSFDEVTRVKISSVECRIQSVDLE
jgi:hypothetical protein